ncbi:1-phosphofructokinase family hexose kinase [Planosporangium sp. 12N6]|uniref:1-phosphofructokinase family hexose kinase n=1 Tax=Planosporangium spinosum TaxID=3402278 RepID=UPI003CEA1DFC
MILTVTPNPALDATYLVDEVRPGGEHRVREVRELPGGKGVNLARVVHALGVPVRATGLTMGGTGQAIKAALRALGIEETFVHLDDGGAARRSRRTVVVVDDSRAATSFWEPGPQADADDLDRLIGHVDEQLSRTSALTVSGSLPRGLPPGTAARLASRATARGVPALVDTSGPGLVAAARSGAVLKPNRSELAEALGRRLSDVADTVHAARELVDQGAAAVVVTAGPDGLVAVTGTGAWQARPSEVVRGNPTGAGDACAAALAIRLAGSGSPARVDWPRALAEATALSAAAVLRPVAGEVDLDAYRRWVGQIHVEEIA